ncbi:glutathione synthase [Cristinia sonorae]|uniref:Glutathione synthetase n=1 Tax=Cristinia sonorae TaxID=1940300 RepID=A0A8K0UFH7_9AGAR|nr:glutathione synthase [Cristinia sonorae]
MASPTLQWPPDITESEAETLTLLATTYALSHGLVYLPVASIQPPAPTSSIHAPLSLFPSPIPRNQFEKARRLQNTYNVLYARVATDVEFLDRVMGEEQGVGQVDEFTGQLWRQWKRLRSREAGIVQKLHLGLFRSDYMVHAPQSTGDVSLKQVEFNTISSSFGTLSQRSAQMHRYLHSSTGYFGSSPYLKSENFPPNSTTSGLAEGLAAAHRAYGVPESRILFVVQPNERNVFDQRFLEYELLEKHSIHVIRQTFDELAISAEVDPQTHVLRIRPQSKQLADSPSAVEISTVYFRAGYTPTDYPTPAHYDIRGLLESSRAIQCPSIPLQLAGGKKVQEELTKPGVLEHFLCSTTHAKVFTAEDLADIRSTWMEMWSLDQGGDEGVSRAREHSANLVLKPQREGGGNNVYKDAIPAFLDSLPEKERAAWIAMRLIAAPKGLGNYLVRAGGTGGAVKTNVISELGIFGWALFGGDDGSVDEKEVGWLVRTKGEDSNEGGVAAGFSVLDSVVLVD